MLQMVQIWIVDKIHLDYGVMRHFPMRCVLQNEYNSWLFLQVNLKFSLSLPQLYVGYTCWHYDISTCYIYLVLTFHLYCFTKLFIFRPSFEKLLLHYPEWKHYLQQNRKIWSTWTWGLLVAMIPNLSQGDVLAEWMCLALKFCIIVSLAIYFGMCLPQICKD